MRFQRSYPLVPMLLVLGEPVEAQEEFSIGRWFSGVYNRQQVNWNAWADWRVGTGRNAIHSAYIGRALARVSFNQSGISCSRPESGNSKVKLYNWMKMKPPLWHYQKNVYWTGILPEKKTPFPMGGLFDKMNSDGVHAEMADHVPGPSGRIPSRPAFQKKREGGESTERLSMPGEEAKNREKSDDFRLGKKLGAGVLAGAVGGLLGAQIMLNTDDSNFGWVVPATFGFWGGNVVGTPIGVSAVDPHDNFLITFAGSLLGGVGVPYTIGTLFEKGEGSAILLFSSAFFGPIVGATIASEWWRKPPFG